MCGFAGIYLLDPDARPADLDARIARMAQAIAHRGPDAQNVIVEPYAGAGFRRLAIIDLVTGDQPVKGGDERIQVFFNGEIYNHLELRDKLRREHGVAIDKGSDAAVLPHLYEHYGEDFVELLNGMFAICVLDGRDRSCRLYRDRLGIKPLYFAERDGKLVFGSELKTLFASGYVDAAIDPTQVVPFLELFYVPGAQTICEGVEKLLPGERMVLQQGLSPRRERWWRLAQQVTARSGDRLDEIDALLADATRLQLIADVPVGISLSGGLDSSLIAHYAHQALTANGADADVRAFTIAFPDTDPGELDCARQVSKKLGIEQIEITAKAGDFLAELDATTFFNDEPVADPAVFSSLLVCRAAAEHVKVLLAGSGADELFAGYGHYRLTGRCTAYRLLSHVLGDGLAAKAVGMNRPAPERAAIRAFARDRMPYHGRAMTHLSDADRDALRGLVHRDHLQELAECFATASKLDARNQQLCVDTETYLPHQLLSLLDRTTMGVSIEGRVPFLDHRVAEFALSIHGDHKFGNKFENKLLLRRLAQRHLPGDVSTRKKHGFPNAVTRWLSPDAMPTVRAMLRDPGTFVAETFPHTWLDGMMATPESVAHNALTLHSLLVLSSWHRVFVQQETPAATTAAAHG